MKRFVIAGAGSRGIYSYILPLTRDYGDWARLCGIYDLNPKRAAVGAAKSPYPVPVYADFDRMLEAEKPDTVIVCTKDSTHHTYIIRALEFGCDVISEKPITTTAENFRLIREAELRTGKKVTITFNCRFMRNFVRVKELLREGQIGEILSAHYLWTLDRSHGADYFRRWHRQFANSGSLMVHKSTHHFDLLNWFLDDEPEKVNAFGTSRFYGPTRENRGERCLTCAHKKTCEFYMDIETASGGMFKELYLDCEDADGYWRDGCVFSDEVDIEDSVSVNIRYKKGAVASYSLIAYSPFEGLRLVLHGTKGRMEVVSTTSGPETGCTITVYDENGEVRVYKIPAKDTIGHVNADAVFRDAIFRGMPSDALGQSADSWAGAMSIGIGIAATTSMHEDRAVRIDELFAEE